MTKVGQCVNSDEQILSADGGQPTISANVEPLILAALYFGVLVH